MTTSAPETEAPVTEAPETEAPETDAPVATEPSEGSDEDQTEDIVISAPSFASPLTDEKLSSEQEPPITEGNDTQTPPPAPSEQTPPTAPSDPVTPAAPEKQEEPTGNTENTDETQKTPENEVRNDVPSDEQNNVPTVTESANAVPASDPENGQENDTPAGETNSTYSIIINYVFTGGKQAAPSWSATVATGSNYTQDIQSPVVVGYAPSEAIVHVNTSEAKTYTVTYQPAEVEFTVKHYQQNVSNDQYTLVETESKKGFTESQVGENLAKTEYTGFSPLLYDTTTKIAADGSTVVEIYYDRQYYLISLDLDGGYGAEPIYGRYGSDVNISDPEKAGYSFEGWEPSLPDTMPVDGGSYKAKWTAGNAKYLVQYWRENANDDGYSYWEKEELYAVAGTKVSGTNNKNYEGFEFDHADNGIVINGDESTVVNVYYKRKIYSIRFYERKNREWSEITALTITAKYEEKIGDKWPTYNGSCAWSTTNTFYGGELEGPYQVNIDTMPINGGNYYGPKTGNGSETAYYYVQVLPGENGINYNGVTYKEHHHDTSPGTGYKITDEDMYPITGFTYKERMAKYNHGGLFGNSYWEYNNAKFYYIRNNYNLVFNDNYSGTLTEELPYEQTLSESTNYKNNYQPNYPSTLPAGIYSFEGWYLDPGCTQPVDWTAKMPADNVVVYAKWTPIVHEVKFYKDIKDGQLIEQQGNTLRVPHGAIIAEDEIPEVTNGNYDFVGWFYKDNGVEKAFDPKQIPVTKDLELYAKWSSNKVVKYTIKYTLEDGTEIATETNGSALAGTTKTFDAKAGSELNTGYHTGYFPQTNSHSLTMDISGNNEYTFIYVPKEKVKYTVRYLEKGTNAVLHDEKSGETFDAVITEKFEQITGYAPDAYQKRLVLSANDAENVITFWYTKDDTHAPVQIIHWIQNIEGEGYTEYQSSTDLNAKINDDQLSSALSIAGFTYVKGTAVVDNETTSYSNPKTPHGVLTEKGLVLNLYYDRIEYPYEFRFIEQGTDKELADPVTDKARYQAQVTHKAPTIPGYTLVSAENQAINIAIEDPANVAAKNVKTFYYTEQMVDIKYQVVGPNGCGTLDIYQEAQLKVINGTVNGSKPTAKEGFKFIGWFKDEACTQAVDKTWIAADNKLTPQKTKDLGNNVMGYEAATYYAKFEYNLTSLTITKKGWKSIDENQSFIFKVTGAGLPAEGLKVVINFNEQESVTIAGLSVGETYTVTEESGWSWRYSAGVGSKTLEADATQNVITINNDRNKNQWLNGCAYAPNKFGSPIINN